MWTSNKKSNSGNRLFSLADRVGFGALTISLLLLIVDARLAIIPLAGFLLLCLVAPFFPRFGFYLPIISRGKSGKKAIAITFDDGPDPFSTRELLKLLAEHQVKATFFVTGEKASLYPELVAEIVAQGHDLGNHTYHHDPLIMFRRSKTLTGEIVRTQETLRALGYHTFAFRAPAGITGPRLGPVLKKVGLYAIHFSCRGLDGGNRRIKGLSKRILNAVGPDDIVALHDIPPKGRKRTEQWLDEIESILSGMAAKGLAVLPLSELIETPIMTQATTVPGCDERKYPTQ